VKKRLDIEVKASGFLTKSLEENLKQLELLDNYNKLVREVGPTALDENYNSEDDEQMLEGNEDSEGEGEGNENEEEKKEDGEEEKVESEEGDGESGDEDSDEEGEEESEEEEDDKDKKKKPKEKKEKKEKKKKDDKKEDEDEYIDNIMKKKFKPRRVVRIFCERNRYN